MAKRLRSGPRRTACDARETASPELRYLIDLVAFQIGGEVWRSRSKRLRDEVVGGQVRVGSMKGTWPSTGAAAGALWDGAWGVLSMSVYFRYARVELFG